jgi:hypothetical protein
MPQGALRLHGDNAENSISGRFFEIEARMKEAHTERAKSSSVCQLHAKRERRSRAHDFSLAS